MNVNEASKGVWKAIAAEDRRKIVELLSTRPRTTGELCRPFSVSRFAIMQHLRVLQKAGLVVVRAQGRQRWHTLNPEPLFDVCERWIRTVADAASGGARSMRDAVEFRKANRSA